MKNIFCRIILLSAIITVFNGASFAVPSKDGKHSGPKEAIRPREVVQVYDAKTKTMRTIRKSGTIKVAVIPVQFVSSGPSTSGSYTITNQNLLAMTTNLMYLHNFYNEVAYGVVNIQFTVIFSTFQQTNLQQINGSESCITISTSMAYYGSVHRYSVEGTNGGQYELIRDAISTAAVTSSSFDTVIVVHAGYGNESTCGSSATDNPGDIWSVQVEFTDEPVNGFQYGIVVPAMEYPDPDVSPRGVMCHEFGHYLGLPDIYNTASAGGKTVAGYWCLMDAGEWSNNGYNPTHPCVWCKQYLGLVSPNVITNSQQISGAAPVETSAAGVYQFNVPNNTGEYFLVCFTSTSPYNLYDPGTGVLIWHIDEGVINGETLDTRMTNNDINCYSTCTVSMVPAGNTSPTDTYGDQSNAWPGVKTSFTAPYSNSYMGYTSMKLKVFLPIGRMSPVLTTWKSMST